MSCTLQLLERRQRGTIRSARLFSKAFLRAPSWPLEQQDRKGHRSPLVKSIQAFPPFSHLKDAWFFFLACLCFQTVRLMGVGRVHTMEKTFSSGNMESFKAERPVFNLDKAFLVGSKLCYENRLWPGKMRPSDLCFPLCHTWGPCHQLCSPPRALWVSWCADCCWRALSWRCSCESLGNDEADAPH